RVMREGQVGEQLQSFHGPEGRIAPQALALKTVAPGLGTLTVIEAGKPVVHALASARDTDLVVLPRARAVEIPLDVPADIVAGPQCYLFVNLRLRWRTRQQFDKRRMGKNISGVHVIKTPVIEF